MAKDDISQAQKTTKSALGTATGFGTSLTKAAIPGYTEFSETGGVTPGMKTAAREVGAGGVRSLYSGLLDRLRRSRMIQGGYSPGYGANLASLGRAEGSSLGTTAAGTELNLDEMIRSGRLAGLGGLESLGRMWSGQIPSLTGQTGQLAVAKPSWWQTAGGIMNLAMPFMGGLGGVVGGLGKSMSGNTMPTPSGYGYTPGMEAMA